MYFIIYQQNVNSHTSSSFIPKFIHLDSPMKPCVSKGNFWLSFFPEYVRSVAKCERGNFLLKEEGRRTDKYNPL